MSRRRANGPWPSAHNAGQRMAGRTVEQPEQANTEVQTLSPELIAVRVTNTGESVVHFTNSIKFDSHDSRVVHLTESGVRKLQSFSTLQVEVV